MTQGVHTEEPEQPIMGVEGARGGFVQTSGEIPH